MTWPQELMKGVVEDFYRKQKEAFAAIETTLGGKVICSDCGCTIANFGEACRGPHAPEVLESGMACEGVAAIFKAAHDELDAWSFVGHRRVLDRFRVEFSKAAEP